MHRKIIRVLIVDDEKMIRLNLQDFLEDEGFEVTTASSGEEGLTLLKTGNFNVAVVDMRLPGIDGNTFIQEAHQLVPTLQYIIHTGSTNYSIPPHVSELGVCRDFVFIKPVNDMSNISQAIKLLLQES